MNHRYFSWVSTITNLGNILEYSAVLIILFMTFYFQIVLHELPCPLCLLQRVGMIGIIFGFLLNFRFGYHPSHYAIVLLSALFTAFVAMRQIALHVIPGTGAYGDAIFGYHLYTWAFIIAMVVVVTTIVLMSLDPQYHQPAKTAKLSTLWMKILFIAAGAMLVLNMVSVVMECGWGACPDNPVKYEMLGGV